MSWRVALLDQQGRPVCELALPDHADGLSADFPIPHAVYGIRARHISREAAPPPVGPDGSVFGWPWAPEHEGSSDGDYGPDQIVTCLICGAAVDDRSISGGRESHAAWHRKHGDITPQKGPA